MTEIPGQLAKQRQNECGANAIWLEQRIGLLSSLNWLTVLVPSLLAVVAGSAMFAGKELAPYVAGAALFAAILSAIHKGLDCEIYQAECRRLLKDYRAMSVGYRTLNDLDLDDQAARLLELEVKLEALSKTDCITKVPTDKSVNSDD